MPKLETNDVISSICFVVNIVVITFILLSQNLLPPVVPLFYGLPIGEEILTDRTSLIIPAIISIIVIAINVLISKSLKDSFLKKVLISIIVLTTLLSTITIFKIAFLVGSF